jgi:hypothetical protein
VSKSTGVKGTQPSQEWSSDLGRVSSHTPNGLDVDGYIAPLDGEPPIAKTRGWGDLSWQRFVSTAP